MKYIGLSPTSANERRLKEVFQHDFTPAFIYHLESRLSNASESASSSTQGTEHSTADVDDPWGPETKADPTSTGSGGTSTIDSDLKRGMPPEDVEMTDLSRESKRRKRDSQSDSQIWW
ncbi:hypothetical protein V866_004915 [Kwoniella sp. B9012]